MYHLLLCFYRQDEVVDEDEGWFNQNQNRNLWAMRLLVILLFMAAPVNPFPRWWQAALKSTLTFIGNIPSAVFAGCLLLVSVF